MRKSQIFWYAVIWHPNASQMNDGESSQLIVAPTATLVNSVEEAKMEATLKIPQEYRNDVSQLQIEVNPF